MTAERPTRVLVDALALKPELGGIATYTRAVVRELSKRDDMALTVVTGRPGDIEISGDIDVVEAPGSVAGYRARVLWRERHLGAILRERKSDVLFAPTIELPFRRVGVPSAMVVHDLGPAQSPGLYGWPRWLRYHVLLRHSLAIANRVICVSATTEMQLMASMRTDPAKVTVIGEATDAAPSPGAEREHGSNSKCVLHVGAILPHKNFEILIEALARPAASELRLVAAGPASEQEIAALNTHAARFGVEDRFEHRGFVSRSELESLYAHSDCLALPTLNEGFGLPLLEAQSRGIPVAASRIPALLEVGGEDGALWVENPLSAELWATSLARLARDPDLRTRLVTAGARRASMYSWRQVGDELAEELAGLAHGHL